MNYYSTPPRSDEIWHHGIKGMRWGIRRYQNEDGTLTEAGKKRYDAYKTHESLKKRENAERNRLLRSNHRLAREFAGEEHSSFLSDVAREWGLDTKALDKASANRRDYYIANKKSIRKGRKLAKKGVFRQTELKDQLDKLVEKQADYARKNFSKYRGEGHKEYLKNMTSKDPKWRKINEELGKAERKYMTLKQSQYNKKKKRRNRTLSFLTKVQTQQRKPKVYVPIRF